MKAITIQQPYATLIAIGAKKFETRGWKTSYRGPVAIHAGKNTKEIKKVAHYLEIMGGSIHSYDLKVKEWHIIDAIQEQGKSWSDFEWPFGCVVATADLVACLPVALIGDGLPRREMAVGDYSMGRYAWQLENVKLLKPIAAIGKQGLWNWDHGDTHCPQCGKDVDKSDAIFQSEGLCERCAITCSRNKEDMRAGEEIEAYWQTIEY